MLKWEQWKKNSENPYIQWRRITNGGFNKDGSFEEAGINFRTSEFNSFGLFFRSEPPIHFQYQSTDWKSSEGKLENAIAALNTPMPEAVLNQEQGKLVTGLPNARKLPKLKRKDSIIMGVIDVGIPLGHSRLRDQNGKSRVLAAWQQMGTSPTDYLPFGREFLKGEIDKLIGECSGGDHKGWLDEETFNRKTSVVDMQNHFGEREAARVVAHGAHVMDLAAGCDPHEDPDFAERVNVIAVNMPSVDVLGNSGEFLSGSALSGVERIIALADAIWKNSFDKKGEKHSGLCPAPIIINMSFGKQAGAKSRVDLFPAYLDEIKRRREEQVLAPIRSRAEKAASKAEEGKKLDAYLEVLQDAAVEYAISISSDDSAENARKTTLKLLNDEWNEKEIREAEDLKGASAEALRIAESFIWPSSTLNFVMAAGNDNLERCNAILEPEQQETKTLNWRILPDDQSDNFVEVWTSPPKDKPKVLANLKKTINLSLIPPSGNARSPEFKDLHDGVTVAGQSAAIFREMRQFTDKDGEVVYLVRHVICVAPTHRASQDKEIAEAGVWTIELTNDTEESLQCVLSVQSDQGLLPGSAESRRSYFDDPNYTVYDSYEGMGDLVESYSYVQDDVENLDLRPHPFSKRTSPVKRHGTMNATAAHKLVARIAGYRRSDGRPAFYSATGRGKMASVDDDTGLVVPSKDDGAEVITQMPDNSRAPTVALPCDDSAACLGILGAGGANGSVVAMRGTSTAAPQASRLIASELLSAGFAEKYIRQTAKFRLTQHARISEDNPDGTPQIENSKRRFDVKKRPPDLIEVLGRGRIGAAVERQVDRLGRS